MTRQLHRSVVIVGLVGLALFPLAGCDQVANELLDSVQEGYSSVTGTNLFEDIGQSLAGDVSDGWEEPVDDSSWGNPTPYSYSYSYSYSGFESDCWDTW